MKVFIFGAALLLAACQPPMLIDAATGGPVVSEAPVALPVRPAAPPGAGPAGGRCGPREQILARLAARWQEAPIAMGLTATGGLLEVLASPGGLTWTIVVSAGGGVTCIVAAGEGWRLLPAPATGPTV